MQKKKLNENTEHMKLSFILAMLNFHKREKSWFLALNSEETQNLSNGYNKTKNYEKISWKTGKFLKLCMYYDSTTT